MSKPELPAETLARVLIDGIAVQTTVGNLRNGMMHRLVWQAFRELEAQWMADRTIGLGATYTEHGTKRRVSIQIDLLNAPPHRA